MGEPWAGQVKLWATLDGIVKVAESADVENLGPDDPTGSKNKHNKPKIWSWRTLSWTIQVISWQFNNIKVAKWIWRWTEFRKARSNRF